MQFVSDRETILEIRKGEIDKYSFIVKKYIDRIHNYINRKIFDKAEVDDLVQNSFISFYKAINRFNVDKPVLPYLYQIANNEMKMYFRSKKVTYSLNEELKAVSEEETEINLDDYEGYLKILPKEQQKVLKLLGEGYSYQEISIKLSRPINTVRTLIRRARLKISNQKNEKNRR